MTHYEEGTSESPPLWNFSKNSSVLETPPVPFSLTLFLEIFNTDIVDYANLDSIAVSLFGNMTVEPREIHIITKE